MDLQRIATLVRARDLMVPMAAFVTAETREAAIGALATYADFEVVGVTSRGEVASVVTRDGKARPILRSDLVSDATPLGALLDVLEHQPWCFVLGGRELVGYIHASDLNNPSVKLPIYALCEAVERRVAYELRGRHTDEDLVRHLGPDRVVTLQATHERLKRHDRDRALTDLLTFGDWLELAAALGAIDATPERRQAAVRFRNAVAHTGRALIGMRADVTALRRTWRDLSAWAAGR